MVMILNLLLVAMRLLPVSKCFYLIFPDHFGIIFVCLICSGDGTVMIACCFPFFFACFGYDTNLVSLYSHAYNAVLIQM